MKRLTYKHDGKWCINGVSGKLTSDNKGNHWGEAIDRLAEYEDTDLSPEVCRNYKIFEDEAINKGVTFNRIVELMNAETEGRLVVLPCKIGDTVYELHYNRDACNDCDCFSSFYGLDAMCDHHYELYPKIDPTDDDEHCPKHFVEVVEWKMTLQHIVYYLNEIGKTVFFTREEAEAALKGAD